MLIQGQIKWAMAGRNIEKLKKERDALAKDFPATKDTPLLTGDAEDLDSLRKIASQTKVLLSVSGPFAQIGNNVVAACVSSGTHYCDITGICDPCLTVLQSAFVPLASCTGCTTMYCSQFQGHPATCLLSMLSGQHQK